MRYIAALALAGLAGCASNSIVDQVNTTCARIENHTVESNGDCTICYVEGKSAIACVMETD